MFSVRLSVNAATMFHLQVSGLEVPLPSNLHLLSLEAVDHEKLILRLEHLYPGIQDESLRRPSTVSLKHLLRSYVITDVEETVLSANQFLRDSNRFHFETHESLSSPTPGTSLNCVNCTSSTSRITSMDTRLFTVTVHPGEIRTFLVTFAPRDTDTVTRQQSSIRRH